MHAVHAVQVFLRVRPDFGADGKPLSKTTSTSGNIEWSKGQNQTIQVLSNTEVQVTAPSSSQSFKSGDRGSKLTYSHVFDATATQQDVYTKAVQPIVNDFLTGSRRARFCIWHYQRWQDAHDTRHRDSTWCAASGTQQNFCVYFRNERILCPCRHCQSNHGHRVSSRNIQRVHLRPSRRSNRRTLAWRNRPSLKYRSGDGSIEGLKRVVVNSSAAALAQLATDHPTGRGPRRSSTETPLARTACSQWRFRAFQGLVLVAQRFSIVDLAGSERGKRTHNHGHLLREAGNINLSLMTLT